MPGGGQGGLDGKSATNDSADGTGGGLSGEAGLRNERGPFCLGGERYRVAPCRSRSIDLCSLIGGGG